MLQSHDAAVLGYVLGCLHAVDEDNSTKRQSGILALACTDMANSLADVEQELQQLELKLKLKPKE